tara:strand:+ start:1577 stop:1861 length:285 start_codon:yes stop_codon:yes gene_type:complete
MMLARGDFLPLRPIVAMRRANSPMLHPPAITIPTLFFLCLKLPAHYPLPTPLATTRRKLYIFIILQREIEIGNGPLLQWHCFWNVKYDYTGAYL